MATRWVATPPSLRRQRLPVAVLDTSVLVEAWSRVALRTLALPPRPLYTPVWSEWIVGETWRVLARKRAEAASRRSPTIPVNWRQVSQSANGMMTHFMAVMTMQTISRATFAPTWTGSDPEDDPVWATAYLARAHFVVSQNTTDFPPRTRGRAVWRTIEYVTAIEFIEQVLGKDAEAYAGKERVPTSTVRSGRSGT